VPLEFPTKLSLPSKVVFKRGSIQELASEALEYGSRGLIVHGASLKNNGVLEKILKTFPVSTKIETFQRSKGEPTLDEISRVIEKGHRSDVQWIAGIGGGSVLDLAKAAAGLYHAKEKPLYYQEGGALNKTGIPFIAVPTTAGTGSEATPNSVIINPEKRTKLSIRDKSFLAKKIILDAELLVGLPLEVLRYSGMDALVQAYESYISKNATAESDALALDAIKLISRHLPFVTEKGELEHLEPLLLGSFLAGVALAKARLGVIHGIAHPLGVLYDIPHGLVCSVCFIPSIKINREAMGDKYRLMSDAIGLDFESKVKELLELFSVTSPFKGKAIPDKEKIISETLKSGSTAANPKPITRADVEFILQELF
jgi:alcohol dehydrogenase class IV